MNHQEINAKIKALEQKKLALAANINASNNRVNVLNQEIEQIKKTVTSTGSTFRQLNKDLNKKRNELTTTKYRLKQDTEAQLGIPNKIKYYERIKKKTPTDVYDWINENYQEKLKDGKNPSVR